MGLFDGKVVWVTGGGTGIGRACAVEFAREGARVAVSGRRVDKLEEAVAEIGEGALAVPCDVTDPSTLERAVATIVEHFGGLDVAFANAGFAVAGRVWEVPAEHWQRQLDVNVMGVVNTIQAAMPELLKRQGRLALTSSVTAYVPAPRNGPYNASKAAVTSLGQTLSIELAKEGSGVSCTTLHPGFVKSDIPLVRNDGTIDESRTDRRPAWLMWETADAARVIVRSIHRRKRHVVFTLHGKLGVLIGRFAPGLLVKLLSR